MDKDVPHSQAAIDRRMALLLPLASQAKCSRAQVQEAAVKLGLSERQVFTLIKRLRLANGDPAPLVLGRSSGGRGQIRIGGATEDILQAVIAEALAGSGASISDLASAVRRRCRDVGVKPPSASTLRRRLALIEAIKELPVNINGAARGSSKLRTQPPSIQERDLDLLTTLYEGAGQPDGWDRFITALSASYAGGKGAFILHDPTIMEGALPATAGFEEDYEQAYSKYYASINPWMAKVATRPVGLASLGDSLVSRAEILKTEFYHDWLRLVKVETGNSVTLQRDGSRFMIVSVLFPRSTAENDKDGVPRLQRLAPHMLRVSQLNRQISLLQARAQASETALDRHDTALFITDGTGAVIHCNEAGEKIAAAADGLKVEGKIIGAVYSVEAQMLRRLIHGAARASRVITARPGGTMRITRHSGRAAFEVLVTPVSTSSLIPGMTGAFVAIFVRNPEFRATTSSALLQQLYGLTRAEARLMGALLTEDTLETASERFGISKETARSQLKAIFEKTGVRNQLELVRLGMRIEAKVRII